MTSLTIMKRLSPKSAQTARKAAACDSFDDHISNDADLTRLCKLASSGSTGKNLAELSDEGILQALLKR